MLTLWWKTHCAPWRGRTLGSGTKTPRSTRPGAGPKKTTDNWVRRFVSQTSRDYLTTLYCSRKRQTSADFSDDAALPLPTSVLASERELCLTLFDTPSTSRRPTSSFRWFRHRCSSCSLQCVGHTPVFRSHFFRQVQREVIIFVLRFFTQGKAHVTPDTKERV